MALAVFAVVLAAALAFGLVRFRESYFVERPMKLWAMDYPDAASVAHAMAARASLTAEQLPRGTDWIGAFFLAPVWLFWGDLRSGRAETRLQRWRLHGTSNGRAITVQLGPDRVSARVRLAQPALLWARADEPLEHQEGLRPFHPVGAPRWTEAVARLQSLFTAGAAEVRVENQELVAVAQLKTLSPERVPALVFALDALATHLER